MASGIACGMQLHFPHTKARRKAKEGQGISLLRITQHDKPTILKLILYSRRVSSFHLKQFVVRALLGYDTIFQDNNVVGVPYRS
jgi:hypothetical protein